MDTNTNNLLADLETAIISLQSAVDVFPTDKRDVVLFGDWSLKDMLAHFSGWNLVTVYELTLLQNGESLNYWLAGGETNEFNQEQVDKRKGINWDEVYSEFVTTQNALLNKYKELSPEYWNVQFGPEAGFTPVKSILTDIKHIGKDHLDDIRAQLKIQEKLYTIKPE